jgi:hypothetical protein
MLVNIDHQLLGYVKTTRSFSIQNCRSRRGRDRMVVGFTTTYVIGAYHH